MVSKDPKYHSKYYLRNKPKILKYVIDYQQKNKEKIKQQRLKSREKINKYYRKWYRENPRSARNGSIELQMAMNNVRIRDHNTCQWANCGLTNREAPIHVHHIFPKKQYPELELIEEYMICYCANHHGLWHRYRGDKAAHFFNLY